MNKINFNEMLNFEVPENWIDNAVSISSKTESISTKKKPFYLNPRYMGAAAALVVAAGIAAFSLSYLNRDFTPPTKTIVEGATAASTFSHQKDAKGGSNGMSSNGEIKSTLLSETTNPTKKPKATEAARTEEGKEESNEQNIASEELESENTDYEAYTPAQAKPTEPKENPVRNEQSGQKEQTNNTKKPESIIKPQNPTTSIEQQKTTEKEQESSKSEEPESTVLPISKGWTIPVSNSNSYDSDKPLINTEENTEPTNVDDYFTGDIVVTVSPESKFEKYVDNSKISGIYCYVKRNDEQIGIIDFNLYDFRDKGINEMIVNLYAGKCYLPCGKYDFKFICYKSKLTSREEKEDYIFEFPGNLDKNDRIEFMLE